MAPFFSSDVFRYSWPKNYLVNQPITRPSKFRCQIWSALTFKNSLPAKYYLPQPGRTSIETNNMNANSLR